MADISASGLAEGLVEAVHRIRVRLFPNRLQTRPGGFSARVQSGGTLGLEELIANLVRRTRFHGDPGEMLRIARAIVAEV